MSERDSYPHGVPCWVEALTPDPEAARDFYAGIFGWDFSDPGQMPGEDGASYYVARVEGRDVAGIGRMPEAAPGAAWLTQVRTDSADGTAAAALEAGGTVVVEPFDVPPVGRMAVIDDPTGGRFVAWQAQGREGALVVNQPSAWSMSTLLYRRPRAGGSVLRRACSAGRRSPPWGRACGSCDVPATSAESRRSRSHGTWSQS